MSNRKTTQAHPTFTVDSVRAILGTIVRQGIKPGPSEITLLVYGLNQLHASFLFARNTANDAKKKADEVRNAFDVLQRFFESRRDACATQSVPPKIVADEERLFEKFREFSDTMHSHAFELDMDAGLLMPPITHWHDLTEAAAGLFQLAMTPNNPDLRFGLTNDGPVARFLAEVLPLITGEIVTVTAAGKYHLRNQAKKRRG
jgi:hypothetical protein